MNDITPGKRLELLLYPQLLCKKQVCNGMALKTCVEIYMQLL